MKTQTRLLHASAWTLAAMLLFAVASPALSFRKAQASTAQTYCDSYGSTNVSGTDASFTVEYDYMIEYDGWRIPDNEVPAYSLASNVLPNNCVPVAGGNIVGYYDQSATNLIPAFEPGVVMPDGTYRFYPYTGNIKIKGMIVELSDLMHLNQFGTGASVSDFKEGLTQYAQNRGYQVSYSSFYRRPIDINYTALEQMIYERKLGVLFCSKYNFVSSIVHDSSGHLTSVAMTNVDVSHAMVVYGYIIIDYYKDNTRFRSDTYLQVCSGLTSQPQGYVKMEGYLDIQDALVVDVY